MIRKINLFAFLFFQSLELFATPSFPFAPAAGQPGSTAVSMNASNIAAWADGYTNMLYGADVDITWKTPAKALGPAAGDSYDVVSLGRSGEITLTFSMGITDGAGDDFAVFENSFSDSFLELGWVEVSSDGIHFTRFPNASYTSDSVGGFGQVDPTLIYGLAGKYRQGFGTPFDLSELEEVAAEIDAGNFSYSADYVEAFTNNYSYLDPLLITHVKIIDIVGDGTALDSDGEVIYDPYPTVASAGFDLDAVAVLNQPVDERVPQTIMFEPIGHQQLDFQTLELFAEADSGLPVQFSIQSGPVLLDGNVLTFTGTGTVEVVAGQAGDAIYAPASPVLRSFEMAERIQHIFVEPVSNQPAEINSFTVQAYASSGLPVFMEVRQGPAAVTIGATNHVLTLDGSAGEVILRAFQPGDASTAPAADVLTSFQILENGTPVAFSDWLTSNSVPNPVFQTLEDAQGRPMLTLEYPTHPDVKATSRILQSSDLISWTNAVPEILQLSSGNMVVRLPVGETNGFYRIEFEGQ
ncbi:hypothetical protein P4E94_16225 [Pontiellaceae bacterium B12219]|nr:hypothetical protein [Pontiellaceae bacterium B12219]